MTGSPGTGMRASWSCSQSAPPSSAVSSRRLPARGRSRKQFDGCLSFLQMQCYVCIADFEYALDRYGRPYGWGLARYATPEHLFGEDFSAHVYEREPAESRERLRRHLKSILPDASEGQIARILE